MNTYSDHRTTNVDQHQAMQENKTSQTTTVRIPFKELAPLVPYRIKHVRKEDDVGLQLFSGEEIKKIDQEKIVADLSQDMEGYDPVSYFQHFSLKDYDHVLLAIDQIGTCKGLLGSCEEKAGETSFLFLVTGFLSNTWQNQRLMHKMIATTLQSLQDTDPASRVLAARTYNPAWYRMLQGLGNIFSDALFYPNIKGDQPPQLADLASNIIAKTNPGCVFEAEKGVLRDGLKDTPTIFLNQRPSCGDATTDQFFQQTLGNLDLILTILDLRAVDETTRAIEFSILIA